jgi:hypothetical protein
MATTRDKNDLFSNVTRTDCHEHNVIPQRNEEMSNVRYDGELVLPL